MKGLCALILSCACLCAVASAQQPTPPPASEILTWINQNFEKTQNDIRATNGSPAQTAFTFFSLDFNACSVTLKETTLFTPLNSSATEIYGPFNLGDLIPNKISVSVPTSTYNKSGLTLTPVHPIARHTTYSDGEAPGSDTTPGLVIPFATQDMANRQAKAWHDAIVACGGKAVPDNLY